MKSCEIIYEISQSVNGCICKKSKNYLNESCNFGGTQALKTVIDHSAPRFSSTFTLTTNNTSGIFSPCTNVIFVFTPVYPFT